MLTKIIAKHKKLGNLKMANMTDMYVTITFAVLVFAKVVTTRCARYNRIQTFAPAIISELLHPRIEMMNIYF